MAHPPGTKLISDTCPSFRAVNVVTWGGGRDGPLAHAAGVLSVVPISTCNVGTSAYAWPATVTGCF
ncbi:hypothetical protein OZ656_06145 [Marinobacter sp. LM1]|uniref:hypothetical protein n=1 Tax=Marinobacter TaxID=2742 RepID=UPI001C97AADB|nr:hypothetical protein [Marinobacter nauticus]MBY6102324.1 hypothetical protein [Marinobacter nauticus]